jgi:hypothetical protein
VQGIENPIHDYFWASRVAEAAKKSDDDSELANTSGDSGDSDTESDGDTTVDGITVCNCNYIYNFHLLQSHSIRMEGYYH